MACRRRGVVSLTAAAVILALLLLMSPSPTLSFSKYETPDQCSWSADNETGSGRMSVLCRVRTLDGEGTNLSALQVEGTTRLRVGCSQVLLFESSLPPQAFHRLSQLEELIIEDCKILQLPPESFTGLRDLKRLSINTYNSEWGSGKSLELAPNSLYGLKELQILDLADNNIRAFPEDVFCSLGNLQTLNLTRNRIRDASNLGYASKQPAYETSSIPRDECTGGLDVRALDVSWNQLQILRGDSGITRLRQLRNYNICIYNITNWPRFPGMPYPASLPSGYLI
ncbi:hypothetical protein L9F63_009026 [Diploptera punctata]|uniref:Uncharacterized protein n=1 Tax=Diploptera punctata TaxID=6984 RepID=A0AAD7Z456_DIPPU|nr:hypothetical protein L9F63_009026 [Diploptera punctata]